MAKAAPRYLGVHDLTGPAAERVLVREETEPAFARASYEINLGCNYDCTHCYLGDKPFIGLPWEKKVRLLEVLRDVGVLYLQVTGGEATVDRDFVRTYLLASQLGILVNLSTNGSRLWREDILDAFRQAAPKEIAVSMYGATQESYEALTQRRGSYKQFKRGVEAAVAAGLPVKLNIIVTRHNDAEEADMATYAEDLGISHFSYHQITPTFNGEGDVMTQQSTRHGRKRKPFTGCNAGHTFFAVDPLGKATFCKIAREKEVDVLQEGANGLRKLGDYADEGHLRTGGCAGCTLSGTCSTCRPLAKLYQEAGAELNRYCQHGEKEQMS
nr:radical SAM protein [Kineosporia mesophila]